MTESATENLQVVTNASASTATATAPPSSPHKPHSKSKFCLHCQKELTRNIRITCAECFSPSTSMPLIELCVECFGVGVEMGDHKKTHSYTVSDCLAYPLVRECGIAAVIDSNTTTTASSSATTSNSTINESKDGVAPPPPPPTPAPTASEWTADEELLLLEGIEMFGMGNWKDIAEHVATKNEKKCEYHYLNAYLNRKDLLPRFFDEPDEEDSALLIQTLTTTAQEPSTQSSSTTEVDPSRPRGVELAGYMPLRGDFDVEYENEAELILADMEFTEEDHPTERELKIKVIEIYNTKLDERERRKQFVMERNLLDYKKYSQSERRRPKDEREIIAQMRPFARFQTPEEHESFCQGLITAMRLRKQILLLQEYRKNGVRTLAEAQLYDVEKKKRESELAMQKQRDSASYLYETGRPTSGGRERTNRWLNRTEEGGKDGESSGNTTSNTTVNGFDIEATPGCHYLTPKERELCVKLKLLAKHYLVIKDALIRECYRLGYLNASTAKEMVKLDVNKSGQIYDFFVHCGWVCSEANANTVTIPTNSTTPMDSSRLKRKADEITPNLQV